MKKIQAPCGEVASLNHFKTCKHESCQARYQIFLQEKSRTANMLNRYFSKKDANREDA